MLRFLNNHFQKDNLVHILLTLQISSIQSKKIKFQSRSKDTKVFINKLGIDYQLSSVTQSCPTLCDPMNHSMPGLPVHHQYLEFTQTHVHRVDDAISFSVVPFSSCPQSLLASGSFPMSQLFPSGGQSTGVSASVLPMNTRTVLLQDGLIGSPCSPRDSQESSPTLQVKSMNSSVLSFLYSPTLTSILDHWKNHSLD